MINKFVMLFLLVAQSMYARVNNEINCNCIKIITTQKDVSKNDFVNCIDQLSNDTTSASQTFQSLSEYWNSNFAKMNTSFEILSVIPPNYDYYAFIDTPKDIHRLRAIKEVISNLLGKERIEDEHLIAKFNNETNRHILGFILFQKKFFSYPFQDFLLQYAIQDSIKATPILDLRTQIFELLSRINPSKYLEKIFEHILLSEPIKLGEKVMRNIGFHTIDMLSSEIKYKMIKELSKEVFKESSKNGSLDINLLAIDRLLSNKYDGSSRFDSLSALLDTDRSKAYAQIKHELEVRKIY